MRAAALKHGWGAGGSVRSRRDAAAAKGDCAAPVRREGGRGFLPMSGDARAPDGLFPRSLAAFLVVLDVGVALHLVRNLARMLVQIFLPPGRFFFVLAAARLVDLGPRRHLSGVERNLVVVLRAALCRFARAAAKQAFNDVRNPPGGFARAFEELRRLYASRRGLRPLPVGRRRR